jgi:NAD(P)-dependent dehydrogenase (short-subunit alcohol dehydrogenase family)
LRPGALAQVCDVADDGQLEALVSASLVFGGGRIDGLVNNA